MISCHPVVGAVDDYYAKTHPFKTADKMFSSGEFATFMAGQMDADAAKAAFAELDTDHDEYPIHQESWAHTNDAKEKHKKNHQSDD